MFKSQFMEQFSEVVARRHNGPIVPLRSVLAQPDSGEWGEEDNDGSGVKVLRTANFTDFGSIDYGDVVSRKIDSRKIERKALQPGDILIEKSGGTDSKPVGRVVLFRGYPETVLFNNFTALLRTKCASLNRGYLFAYLYVSYWNGSTRPYCWRRANSATQESEIHRQSRSS